MRPQDVLPDDTDTLSVNGRTVRKGSVGAFLANARAMADPAAPPEARAAARTAAMALVPDLDAIGLFAVLAPRDPDLAAAVAEARNLAAT